MPKPVLIFGAKGKGKSVAHILEQNQVLIYGFLDDDPLLAGKSTYKLPILGKTTDQELLDLLETKCLPFIAIEEPTQYLRIWQAICKNNNQIQLINAIHPQAILAKHIQIGQGNCIEAAAYIGADVTISSHCTIAPHTVLGHSTTLHDFVTIGAGTKIGENVHIEESVHISPGVIVAKNVTIGKNTYISPGAIVEKSLPPNTQYKR